MQVCGDCSKQEQRRATDGQQGLVEVLLLSCTQLMAPTVTPHLK